MKKLAAKVLMLLLTTIPVCSYAEIDFSGIISAIGSLAGINLQILEQAQQQFTEVSNINANLGTYLNGKNQFGAKGYEKNIFEWGDSVKNWQEVLTISKEGNESPLKKKIAEFADQFPIHEIENLPNAIEKEYYQLQAQTVVTARAAAELTYQQTIKQEKVLQKLHEDIDQVESEKAASDLGNRLLSEQARASLQQTKMLSTLVQQQAVDAQERAKRMKEDLEFFAS